MRNKYLLLGAASTLMLAACSEDINQGPDNNRPVENALNLTSLSPASQAGRVSLPGQTRGQKSERLQLVAKIAPVADAADNNWSATGIAIANGNAYVSWHSNRQATNQATAWGGAIDVIAINALVDGQREGVISQTLTSETAKFNGIVADGSTFYLPITSYSKGAQVGRWVSGTEVVDTITVPGVSANSVAVRGNDLYAVTGYKGGLYSFPTADFGAETRTGITENIAYDEAFGGKYIDGDRVLRTDDKNMEIVDLAGNHVTTGDPLVSNEKQAETYNPETGEWTLVDGTNAKHYGKHTMAVDGNYIYVGGGVTEGGKNGLRVYFGTNSWSNGTSTTAVTVATVGDQKLVFAATGAGLRVYEPYNTDSHSLPLYAFEVLNYDENGNAVKNPENNKFEAGTDAHSANFVAVDGVTGLIFVACGQSGVYVFKLDTTVEVAKWPTGFEVTEGGESNLKEVPEGETETFTVPTAPTTTPEGKDFAGWEGSDGNTYQPGDEKELESKNVVTLKPIWKDHEYKYTLKFDGNKEGVTVSNLPGDIKSDEAKVTVPDMTPTVPAGTLNPAFIGWATDPEMTVAHKEAGLWTPIMPGDEYTFTEEGTVTLYAIWATNATAGGNQGGNGEEEEKPEQGNGGGAGDSNSGTM